MKELLGSAPASALQPCLGTVGLQIVPLLKQLDQSFNLGLPVDDIERKFLVPRPGRTDVLTVGA